MPLVDRSATIAQITLDHPECIHVFLAHRIDFCCRGGLTVQEACAGKGLLADGVFADLDSVMRAPTSIANGDPRTLPTPQLIEYIVARHHAYLRKMLPFAEQLGRKVARVHGEHDPKLSDLAELVSELRETLEPHLDEEERSLFPLLASDARDPEAMAAELRAMHDDHLRVGELLTCMRTLANDYAVPDWACRTYSALLDALRGIELDTMRHVQIENHVLMPRFVRTRRHP